MGSRAKASEFDILRRKAKQRFGAEEQVAGEGIRRRFASLGALQSGAAIKQEQLAKEGVKRRGEEALGTIDIAEQKELQRRKEIQEQREFVGQQALAGRQFQAGESALQRRFAGEQAGIQRGFAAGESELGRKFAGEEGAAGRAATAALQVGQIKSQEKIAADSLSVSLKSLGLQQQQIDNALDLGLKQIGVSEQQLALAKEQGIDQLQLGRDQMEQALELGLKAQGMQQQQIDMAKDQFDKEFQENLKTNYINSVIAFSNTELDKESFNNIKGILDSIGISFDAKGLPTFSTTTAQGVQPFSQPFGRINEFGQVVDSDGDVL